ncbi:hypothetical protein [Mucilaginibacter sp.]
MFLKNSPLCYFSGTKKINYRKKGYNKHIMTQYRMIKAFGRALFITFLLVSILAALWHYTIATIVVLLVGWLTFMFYMDPPEDWDR